MAVDYYEAYRNGFRAGEVDRELGSSEGSHFCAPPPEANPDAWHEAQMWGYQEGLEALEGSEPRSRECVEMHLDNEYCI